MLTKAGKRVVLLDGGETDDLTTFLGVDGRGNRGKGYARRARPLRVGQLTFDRFRMLGSSLLIARPRPALHLLDMKQAAETIDSLLSDADVGAIQPMR